jgi:hypothetical protein
MKHLSKYFFLTSFIFTLFIFNNTFLVAEDKQAIAKVFLLAGQSNMVGEGKPKELPKRYRNSPKNVKIWKNEKWEPLIPNNVHFGPEISFGHSIKDFYPNQQIYLIKHAAKGSNLYRDWKPKKGKQAVQFSNKIKKALSKLKEQKISYHISGMMWLQGESDAAEGNAMSYAKNLIIFIEHIRNIGNNKEMPFIIARVLDYFGSKTGQAQILRNQQIKVATKDTYADWFSTDHCEKLNPGHYNSNGCLEIGRRFARTYHKLVNNIKNTKRQSHE